MKNDCLFCGIVHDEIPSYKLYEDDLFLVILDRFPTCLGHVLILPKKHAATLFDLPDDAAQALLVLAKRVAKKMHEVLNFDGLNLLQNNGESAGQEVRHFHLHLIPRFDQDSIVFQNERLDPAPEVFEEMAGRLSM